jgi:hypothetical protein
VRGFAVKTELVDASGQHIRYLPAEFARVMVRAGHAAIANTNGKVRIIRLVTTASTCAKVIGPPSNGWSTGVRFTRWVRLEESATRVIEFQPRSRDYE